MSKKHSTLLVFTLLILWVNAQEYRLKPGEVFDSIQVVETDESYSIYLPPNYEPKGKWPVLLIFNLQGEGQKQMQELLSIAATEGYLLASSHQVQDSLSITDNVLITDRMIESMKTLFSIHLGRVYTYGRGVNARFANLVPILLKDVEGVLSDGAGLANRQLLNTKNPFHFIGVVRPDDFNYPLLLQDVARLKKIKFRNQLLVEQVVDSSSQARQHRETLRKALRMFTLAAMDYQFAEKDSLYLQRNYTQATQQIGSLFSQGEAQRALQWMEAWKSAFGEMLSMTEWEEKEKIWKKSRLYKTQRREEETAFFKENILKEDFIYYLQEDMEVTNFNNLGWWNSQVADLKGFIQSPVQRRSEMGYRLIHFVNALVDDSIDLLKQEGEAKEFDEFLYLWMLKTLTAPDKAEGYLKVASLSSYREDYGTALFYLEELLKSGYKDRNRLYAIEDTALLRIMPEFNALINKYFKDSRYQPK